MIATTSKDKKLRIIDARNGEVLQEADGHKGAKASRVAWCGSMNRVFTTGFSKMNERQYGIWNAVSLVLLILLIEMKDDLSSALKLEMIDTSSGVLFPIYDEDTHVMYVAGKVAANSVMVI